MRLTRLLLLISLIVFMVPGCGRKAAVEEVKSRWVKLRHEPIEEAKVGTEATVEAEVEVSEDIKDARLFLYYKAGSQPREVVEMHRLESGRYFISIPSQKRGTLVEYYVEARAGGDLAVRVPGQDKSPGFSFYYKGTANRAILISHVILMFVSLAILLLAGYFAVRAVRDRRVVLHIPRLAFLGAVVFFISSFPLGMIVAYQTYGTPWTGFPVGTDITDNKSLAIVLYWAAATFLYRGSVFKKDPSTDLLSIRTLPFVYATGVLLTIVLFLIPH
jgi:hypothetical protein